MLQLEVSRSSKSVNYHYYYFMIYLGHSCDYSLFGNNGKVTMWQCILSLRSVHIK